MKKEYQKAEVKVYEMEIEYALCESKTVTTGSTLTPETEDQYTGQ